MGSLKGTQTAENLMRAFAGESQARSRYTYYASQAEKEGYIQISNIFMETAENELQHAKRFFNLANESLNGETVQITATYPVALGDTKANLLSAANGENEEWSALYPEFGNVAENEGFPIIAAAFRNIAKVEAKHEARFRKFLDAIENGTVFKKETTTLWKCINCGFIYEGLEAPQVCPSCTYPKAYFEVFTENY
jgi:rubrerythrin